MRGVLASLAFGIIAGFISGTIFITERLNEQFQAKLNEQRECLLQEIEKADKEASEVSKKYYEERSKSDGLYSTNLQLANRLHELERSRDSDGKGSRCVTHCPACGNISARDATTLIEMAKRADEAAQYAQACYEWVNKKPSNK